MPRKSSMLGKTIKPITKENTRRPNSKGYASLQLVMDEHKKNGYKGVTYEKYIELGGRPNDLKWDLTHNLVTVS